jgi:hypothetical protein
MGMGCADAGSGLCGRQWEAIIDWCNVHLGLANIDDEGGECTHGVELCCRPVKDADYHNIELWAHNNGLTTERGCDTGPVGEKTQQMSIGRGCVDGGISGEPLVVVLLIQGHPFEQISKQSSQ